MIHPIEFVKSHPMPTAVGVIVIVVLFVIIKSAGGGGSTAPQAAISATGGADNGAAVSIAQQQANLAASQFNITANKDVALGNQATAITLAQLDAGTKSAELSANLQLGEDQIKANTVNASLAAGVQTSQNTLAASLEGQRIKASSDATAAQFATLNSQITTQAQTAAASLAAQTQIAQINKPQQGLFSWLFG